MTQVRRQPSSMGELSGKTFMTRRCITNGSLSWRKEMRLSRIRRRMLLLLTGAMAGGPFHVHSMLSIMNSFVLADCFWGNLLTIVAFCPYCDSLS